MLNRLILLPLASLMLLGGCALHSTLVESRNVDAVRLIFSEVWSKGNVDLVDELYATDVIGHFPGGETFSGREGFRSHVIAHRRSFPDWTEEIDDLVVEGNRVVARFTSRGTNLGRFLDRPPTGNRVEISEVAIFRVNDAKIEEQWVYPDMLNLQRQLQGGG